MIGIIIASNRQASQSQKVGHYIQQSLRDKHIDNAIIDLQQLALPLWSEESFTKASHWQQVSKKLKKMSAFVIVVPEWDGMACPTAKNFFNYCRDNELFHKPALLVAVSSGRGGAYPISELRMSSYKNSRICYLPEHVIVRLVESVLNEKQAVNDDDALIRARLDYAVQVLCCYQKAFKHISNEKFLFDPIYQNGM